MSNQQIAKATQLSWARWIANLTSEQRALLRLALSQFDEDHGITTVNYKNPPTGLTK